MRDPTTTRRTARASDVGLCKCSEVNFEVNFALTPRHMFGDAARWSGLTLEPHPLGYHESIVLLDPEIAGGVLDAGVPKKKLSSTQVAGLLVEQRHLGTTQRMRSVLGWTEPGELHPVLHETFILTRRDCTSGSSQAAATSLWRGEASILRHIFWCW